MVLPKENKKTNIHIYTTHHHYLKLEVQLKKLNLFDKNIFYNKKVG